MWRACRTEGVLLAKISEQKDAHTVRHIGLVIHTAIAFCAAIDFFTALKAGEVAVG